MRRRELIAAMAGGSALWLPAWAALSQSVGRRPRVGFLGGATQANATDDIEAFLRGLRALGYRDGETFDMTFRFADGHYERLPALAKELVDLKCDVILAVGNIGAIAVRQAAPAEPVVVAVLTDPVRQGLATSEARPGGSVTGMLGTVAGLSAKQVELAKEMVPGATKIGLMVNGKDVTDSKVLQQQEIEAAAPKFGISVAVAKPLAPDDLADAIERLGNERVDVLIVAEDGMFFSERQRIAELAAAARLPAIYGYRDHVQAGGLVSYGIDLPAMFERLAVFVDKIIKGTPPGEIPIEFPTKLELWINLKTAKTLGVTIPPAVLVRADEVIE